MKVRLGYVSISKALNATTSSTVTFTNYEKENFPVEKLFNTINKNLDALEEIIKYNIKNEIYFYRLTSKLIPLATHNKVKYDYITKFKESFRKIGELIDENNIRIDTHPDQYAVLNSINKNVFQNTIEILKYHYEILKALNIKVPIIIIHVGSSTGGKKASLTRFINNFNKLPNKIQKCIAIENDDKVFNIKDTLYLCKNLKVPMVLDYHHYICNNDGEKIEDYINEILDTWKKITPKIHFSSPKNNSKKDFRSHSDYIIEDDFIKLIKVLKLANKDIDIMLEAKEKDEALFRLVRQLKYKTNFIFDSQTTFVL